MAAPPLACTSIIQTPSRVAAAQACATVLGMSWNLRSRNTRKPRRTSSRTSPASATVKSSLPTFTAHSAGSSRAARPKALIMSGKSRATMTRGDCAALPGSVVADEDDDGVLTRKPRAIAPSPCFCEALWRRRLTACSRETFGRLGASWRIGLPLSAAGTAPVVLLGAEAAVLAAIHAQALDVLRDQA